jgi:hypothetical protein
MAIEIPQSAAFYVRSALNRSLQQMQGLLEDSKKVLADETAPALARSWAHTESPHWRQWYREAVMEFRQLPESIRPDRDLLDYEV